MTDFDTRTGTVILDVITASAIFVSIDVPATLVAGKLAYATGEVKNIGEVALQLWVDLVDVDTGALIARSLGVGTIPFGPSFIFSLMFTMPNKDFNWKLVLHD